MQASNYSQENASSSHWLDAVELVTVVSAIGGSVAAAVLQQIALTSIPLSLVAALNLVNRRRQLGEMQTQQHLAIARMAQHGQDDLQAELTVVKQIGEKIQAEIEHLNEHEAQSLQAIATLTTQAEHLETEMAASQQSQDQYEAALKTQGQSVQAQFEELSAQFAEIQGAIAQLQSSTSELSQRVDEQQSSSQSLAAQTEGVEELLNILKEIDTLTQAISADPKVAQTFYQRGLARKQLERLEDQRLAIDDFSQALDIDPTFASAYFERGLLKSEIGHKQHAVDDLRMAAKFYFDQNDLAKYEMTRNLSQKIHDLIADTPSPELETEQYLLENLFD